MFGNVFLHVIRCKRYNAIQICARDKVRKRKQSVHNTLGKISTHSSTLHLYYQLTTIIKTIAKCIHIGTFVFFAFTQNEERYQNVSC